MNNYKIAGAPGLGNDTGVAKNCTFPWVLVIILLVLLMTK